jgi:solute carrier family 25 iron transporter 28/37
MDDDEDPYESLPGGKSTLVYMSAGAAAGILEHCVMYPIDVVRTRMQSIRPQLARQTFWNSVTHLIRNERFKTFRGMSAVITGAGPAHALYFSCYENLKDILLNRHILNNIYTINQRNRQPFGSAPNQQSQTNRELFTNNNININNTYHPQAASLSHRALAQSLAGCGATVVHDAVMNPVEVVKQRMQMYKSPFKTSLSCARHILKHEGLRAFYRSYFTQLTMNLPYHSLHFVTYEYMQDLTNRQRDYNPKAHVISGAIAGALASAVTTPLDVCKTLLNTQEKLALVAANSDRITGLLNASRVVYKCCGFRGYFNGIQARVLVAMPSTAISWSVYEFFKSYK